MADFKGPLDYIDVAARIVEFRTKHPQGSLQQESLDFREFGGKSWVIYTACAYRTPDDFRPGMGTAWEEVPGVTPFTKGSELQNAETAAWGRAIVAALAADTKRGIASAEEVRGGQAREKVRKEPAKPVDDLPVEALMIAHEAVITALSDDTLQTIWKQHLAYLDQPYEIEGLTTSLRAVILEAKAVLDGTA